MKKWQRITIYSVGGVLLVFGLLITGFWWYLYNSLVLKQLPLSNGSNSETFDLWTKNSIPLHFNIYMFNWTNAESTIANKEKPKLEQVGPYVYRLEISRKNFVWNANDSVTYLTYQRFYHVPELSTGNPYTDVVTSPNVILLTLMPYFAALPVPLKIMIQTTLEQFKINVYVQKTVSQLLFDGYNDKLLDLLKPFKKYIPPLKMLPDEFAWYLPKNRTMADMFSIYTGQKDLNKLGLIYARNYTRKMEAFNGECGRVHGSPGDFWPVDVTSKQNVSLFISDFCSTFLLEKMGQQVVNDIDGIRFEGRESTFDNGSQHAEMSCYCPGNRCKLPSGIRNVTSCVNAPLFISFPHFYGADESYLDAVEGLSPNKDLHTFHMTFQKDYGVLLNGAARLQINMHLEPVPGFKIFQNVPNVFLPTFWFEETINLPSSLLDKLHKSFTTMPRIFTVTGLVLVILGSIILVCGIIITRMSYQSIPYVNETL